ncbi:AAEL007021-PA, partial [Aedes aegypti]
CPVDKKIHEDIIGRKVAPLDVDVRYSCGQWIIRVDQLHSTKLFTSQSVSESKHTTIRL